MKRFIAKRFWKLLRNMERAHQRLSSGGTTRKFGQPMRSRRIPLTYGIWSTFSPKSSSRRDRYPEVFINEVFGRKD
jgi:hypothetical protein